MDCISACPTRLLKARARLATKKSTRQWSHICHFDRGSCNSYSSAAFACINVTITPSCRAFISEHVGQNHIKIGAETAEIIMFFSPNFKYIPYFLHARTSKKKSTLLSCPRGHCLNPKKHTLICVFVVEHGRTLSSQVAPPGNRTVCCELLPCLL